MEEIAVSGNVLAEAIDFSLFSLFLRADLVVKSVILILIVASIYSWTIIVSKIIRMQRLKQLNIEFDEIFWSGNSFDDLYETFNYIQDDIQRSSYILLYQIEIGGDLTNFILFYFILSMFWPAKLYWPN